MPARQDEQALASLDRSRGEGRCREHEHDFGGALNSSPKRLIEGARELECDDEKARFEERLKKIAKVSEKAKR